MTDDEKFSENSILFPLDPVSERKGVNSIGSSGSRESGRFSVLLMPTSSAREQESQISAKEDQDNDQATRNAFDALKNKKNEKDKLSAAKPNPFAPKNKGDAAKKTAPGAVAEKRTAFGQTKAKAPTTGALPTDYRNSYLKKQRDDAAAKSGNVPPEQKAIEERKRLQKETNDRVRAKELLDQKIWWQQQFGNGQYDDTYIYGMIAAIDQEMGAIDVRFWP